MKVKTHPSARQEVCAAAPFEQILGIPFFNGTAEEAVAQMAERGALLVASFF